MLFIISVSRSFHEAQARAVSQKLRTSPGRKNWFYSKRQILERQSYAGAMAEIMGGVVQS